MVINATFNDISFLTWRSMLLCEDTVKIIDLLYVTERIRNI